MEIPVQEYEAIEVRAAAKEDERAIKLLVRGERLNPLGLRWSRFLVATDNSGIVGAVQLREHFDGSRELGSLVVRKDARGKGVATRLIDALLLTASSRVFMITGAPFAQHYERWGFQRLEPANAPAPVCRNYRFRRFGGALAFLVGRRPNRPVVLVRAAPALLYAVGGAAPRPGRNRRVVPAGIRPPS